MNTLVKIIVTIILSFVTAIVDAQESSNLWKIEGKDIKTSYLFGTMHLIPQKDFTLKEKVKAAFESSEQLVLEIDMLDPQFMKDVMAYTYLEKGTALRQYMDDSEYELLEAYLIEKSGNGMQMFNSAKPFLLMSTITSLIPNQPMASFEMALMTMAKASHMEVEGLETFASQANLFELTPYEKQLDDLVEIVNNQEETRVLYATMAQLYIEEDVEGLYNYMDIFMKNDVVMMEKMLDERNNNWIPKIVEFSKTHATFYAVGGAHLGGNQGVINLLKGAGYTVTPIMD